jgi:acid phosphatase
MWAFMRAARRPWIAVAGFVVLGGLVFTPAAPLTADPSVPAFDHIFAIVMENHSFDQIIGSSQAPYTNVLASRGLATNYFAISHPSLPNYLALSGGDTSA